MTETNSSTSRTSLPGTFSLPVNEKENCRCGGQLELFTRNLPKRPYAVDQLGDRLLITSPSRALRRRHIQANPPWMRVFAVFDIDARQRIDRGRSQHHRNHARRRLEDCPHGGALQRRRISRARGGCQVPLRATHPRARASVSIAIDKRRDFRGVRHRVCALSLANLGMVSALAAQPVLAAPRITDTESLFGVAEDGVQPDP